MAFILYLDEDVSTDVADLLAREGFDVLTTLAAGRANQGFSDEEQLALAADLGRAILTHNVKDFEVIARRWARDGREHAGIIVSRYGLPWALAAGVRILQQQYPEGIAGLYLRLPRP